MNRRREPYGIVRVTRRVTLGPLNRSFSHSSGLCAPGGIPQNSRDPARFAEEFSEIKLERAMGIEPMSEAWERQDTRRNRLRGLDFVATGNFSGNETAARSAARAALKAAAAATSTAAFAPCA